MMRLNKFLILLYIVFGGGIQESYSKARELKVEQPYTYVLPPTESEAFGLEVAEMRAKLYAIEQNFGTIISMQTTTEVDTHNGHSDMKFISQGLSEVKGEWIQNLSAPEFNIERTDGMTVIHCIVRGIIREIIDAPVSFEAHLLCNGTGAKFERSDFRNGDDIYLSFLSPNEGFVAVYLRDEQRNAFRLLPYPSSHEGALKVNANDSYIFFSHEKAKPELSGQTVAYHLTSASQLEHNYIYVIFSPRQFTVPNDMDGEDGIRTLPFTEYEHWIGRLRRQNQDIQLLEIPISIRK